mgnify:CR=1 FL=1
MYFLPTFILVGDSPAAVVTVTTSNLLIETTYLYTFYIYSFSVGIAPLLAR